MAAQRPQIGVFGGTFDPIHNGHLNTAKAVADKLGLDQVLFVPTGESYQKQGVTPAEHRLAMTQLATKVDPRFAVSRVDVDRPGPTYTVDTLRDIGAQNPGADLHFIAGADSIANMHTWKDHHQLSQLANIVGVDRAEGSGSSTEVRQLVGQGHPVGHLVPSEVARYIADNGLYRQGATHAA